MGGVIENCITGFGDVNVESVGMAQYCMVELRDLADTGEGGGKIAYVVCKLDGWYW